MTIWFVIPANRETAFRTAYLEQHVRGADLPDEDETIDTMVPGTNAADESVLLTGSGRVTSAQADAMEAANSSWLKTYPEFPPVNIWNRIRYEDEEGA